MNIADNKMEHIHAINEEEENNSPEYKLKREDYHNNSDSDIDDKKINIAGGQSMDDSNLLSGN